MTGLRADIVCEIVFVDHADVRIRSETYTVFIVVDGATTFVTASAQITKVVMKLFNIYNGMDGHMPLYPTEYLCGYGF